MRKLLIGAVALWWVGAAAAVSSGLDVAGFDLNVRPQDDLFLAANGYWLRTTPIPPDKSDYGVFTRLRDQSDADVRALVEALATHPQPKGSESWKIAAIYQSFVDVKGIDRAGLTPLRPWLAQIDTLADKRALATLLGHLQGRAGTPLVTSVGPDEKDPGHNRAQAWQSGLGLPDRDYYLKDDPRFVAARKAYQDYLQTLFRLGGVADPEGAAAVVMALEKRLAAVQWSKADNRDPLKTYNPMSVPELAQLAPGFDWSAFLTAAALPGIDSITVSQPSYAVALARMLADTPLAVWQLYLKVHLLDGYAPVLPQPFRAARFAFRGQALQGLKEEPPRWQKAIGEVNDAMGEAVGRRYVAVHFTPAHKARMNALVASLMQAYAQSIDTVSWMTPETRQQAKEKLAKYATKIGYPDTWRDYSRLDIRAHDALGNSLRAGRFEYERVVARVGKPVDRNEWHMTPQTVNAYYSPSINEIVFPAAILQPPFFDLNADDAVNYGAIGAIIGHEISHGFDDKGSQFDGDGRLRNWWTPQDRQAFDALTQKLVAQYAAYEPLPGHPLNGQLTLGENIADLSGLQIAYKAYHLALGGKPAPVIDGLSGEQRFFLGWAQSWRAQRRDERALQLLTIDPHAPPAFRANGAVVNHDGFHAAFGTRPGDGLYKPADERIRLW